MCECIGLTFREGYREYRFNVVERAYTDKQIRYALAAVQLYIGCELFNYASGGHRLQLTLTRACKSVIEPVG